MAMRPKIVKLAKVIGGVPGKLNKLDENSPEYYCLECVVSDEQADIAIAAGLRKPRTAEYLAEKTGKPLETARRLALELADIGVLTVWTDDGDGKDRFYMEIFAPGVLERMIGNKEQLAKYPQIGRAFEEYTRSLGAKMSSMLPMGSGLMRVVPIERSIADCPDAVREEKLSYYLDKYKIYSVSDCSCRASRRVIGEGCGHLEYDMCLHLGPAAEFYARTGKARYVTREEAEEIIRKAEENGLMHCMPNINETGDSDSICNCCACACYGLRIGLMFGARDAVRSNFVAKIDEEKCVACGRCVEYCPGNALKMGQKLCGKTELPKEPGVRKISEHSWSSKDWDVDYRENREDVVSTGTAPCKTACPAHIGIQGYIKLAAQGKYREALELIKKENPFPAVCGRICNRRCESECTRGEIDQPVAIDEIKKFIADQELKEGGRYIPEKRHDYSDKKIAIVGAGPAGLSCAYYLALDNYAVTVFEKEERPGGMLTLGIPSFRLEKQVVDAEIQVLKDLGVTFKTGVEVGKDVTLDELRSQGFLGFYLAVGAQGGKKLGIPGEETSGVTSGVDFLRQVNLGSREKLPKRVVVIGGGNVAIDVARTAIRQGAENVDLYCLESEQEMTALPEEVEEAVGEGIRIHNGWGPMEVKQSDRKAAGITFKKCVAVFDENHRFHPVYNEKVIQEAACDMVLVSIGQSVQWGNLLQGSRVELNPGGTAKADPFTYQTAQPDVFVGGDAYTGPKFCIDAIAAGKEAAVSLHRFVQPGQSLTLGRDRRNYRALDKENLELDNYDNTQRQKPLVRAESAETFFDSRVTFTEEQVKKETSRCLGCGATKVDPYLCIGCGQCTTKCRFDAVKMEKRYDVQFGAFEQMPVQVAKYAVKRAGKILATAVKGDKS